MTPDEEIQAGRIFFGVISSMLLLIVWIMSKNNRLFFLSIIIWFIITVILYFMPLSPDITLRPIWDGLFFGKHDGQSNPILTLLNATLIVGISPHLSNFIYPYLFPQSSANTNTPNAVNTIKQVGGVIRKLLYSVK
jgi:hypothetical protein